MPFDLDTKKQTSSSLLGESQRLSYSVTRFNEIVRGRLESETELQNLWVEGELLNLVKHSSGHIYFSVKDEKSQLHCTFFKGSNLRYRHLALKNGIKVLIFGSVRSYIQRGGYQFNVQRAILAGEGELRLEIEEIKKRLKSEGLFDIDRKKSLPFLPVTLGIATAASGAAVKDIMRIALERYPNLNIILAPCQVQGPTAPASIVSAIQNLQSATLKVDVIILGRGGGSFEDLLAFNDESVLRAITDCSIPIVSAVGHEIDSPLSDLVADYSAPTPTAAAEQVIPNIYELLDFLEENTVRMRVSLENYNREWQQKLDKILQSRVYEEPLFLLQERWLSLDHIERRIQDTIQSIHQKACSTYERFSYLPRMFYEKNVTVLRQSYELLWERLQNFSPLDTLTRGYAIVLNENKESVASSEEIHVDEIVDVRLAKGSFLAKVTKLQK